MEEQRDETEARSKEAEASMVSIDGQWPVVYFETHATKEQYAHTHAYSRLESNHEVSRFFIPITRSISLSLSLFSHILLRSSVPGYFYGVVRSSDFRHSSRPAAHITIYRIYIYIQIWCIFKELILDIETKKIDIL